MGVEASMQPLKQFDTLRLLTDDHASKGAPRGVIGCIVEVYGDGAYEVEFINAAGETVAQIVATARELERAQSALD